MSKTIIGIDLGTTNSAVAYLRDGVPQVIEIEGKPSMPSCVGVDSSGNLVVGETALNQLVAAPESTILSIKRAMGTDKKETVGDKSYTPEEISAFILRTLKQHAETHLGHAVDKAVITVPAFFDEAQRKATTNAAALAGLEAVRILNEPTAASLAYDADGADGQKLLVYDLGGGTFDVSVVTAEDGVVEVRSSHGDTLLGGDDFDQCLIDHVVEKFVRDHGVNLTDDLKAMRRLKIILERAKRALTDEPYVRIQEDYLTEVHHLDLEISRAEYEEMISGYLEKTLVCVHRALDDAKMVPDELDRVLLVGGSSRTPAVALLLENRLGIVPRSEVDPDLIVALGAAIQAGNLSGERAHSILVDITPHTFSTSTLEIMGSEPTIICVPIIKRNSALPAAKSDAFVTLTPGQEVVEVTVYQGESADPDENTLIGKFLVQGLDPNADAGNPIIIKFALDLNGMIKVTATEKRTGHSREVIMDTREKGRNFDLDQARENVMELMGVSEVDEGSSPAPAAGRPAVVTEAKNLRKRGEALLETGIDETDRREIQELIRASTDAIRDQEWDILKEKNDSLSDILFYLED